MDIKFTTCPLCEANCGIEVHAEKNRIVKIVGDQNDPFSKGYMCVKARSLIELQADPDRLRKPLIRDGQKWREASWEEALSHAVEGIYKVQKKHGNDALAVFQGNPLGHTGKGVIYYELLTRLLNTKNIFSSASLDHLPQMIVAEKLFGSIGMFAIPDIDKTEFMVIMGANPAVSNGSIMTTPNIKLKLKNIKKNGGKVVVIDPRLTETAQLANQHFFIKPGTDVFFLLTFIRLLFEKDLVKLNHLHNVVEGIDQIKEVVSKYPHFDLEKITGISMKTCEDLVVQFTNAKSAVLYPRVGVSVQEFGTLVHWLTHLINILTGNLDRQGGMMFTNPVIDFLKLAELMGVSGHYGKNRSRVNNYPSFRGEFPVAAMMEEMTTTGKGQVKGLLTVAGNPVLSSPNGTALEKALTNLDFMVSIDIYKNETTRHAHVILPPCFVLEAPRFELVFPVMSVRNRIKFSNAAFRRSENSYTDAEIFLNLAKRIKTKSVFLQLIAKADPIHLLVEVLVKFGFYGKGLNPFSKGLTVRKIKKEQHGIDLGVLTPMLPQRLFTKNKKINLADQFFVDDLKRLEYKTEELSRDTDNDFILIGKRQSKSINSWTHNLPKLTEGVGFNLTIHSKDAARLTLENGDLAKLVTHIGEIIVPVYISDEIMPGVVCLPHGWGHHRRGADLSIASQKPGTSVNDILDHNTIDKLSGTSVLNAIRVKITSVN